MSTQLVARNAFRSVSPSSASETSTDGSTTSSKITAASLASQYTMEMERLIAERDALENRFKSDPGAIRRTVEVLDQKVNELRVTIMNLNMEEPTLTNLPERQEGDAVSTITEKRFFPKKEYPDFNFTGRILGPRGSTIKNLEQRIPSCKLAIRGKGSNSRVEAQRKAGEPEEEQHLSIMITDTKERAPKIMEFALKVVEPFFHPVDERFDPLKDAQMREIALIKTKEKGVSMQFGQFGPPAHIQQQAQQQLPLMNPHATPFNPNFAGMGMGMALPNLNHMINFSSLYAPPTPIYGQAPVPNLGGGGFGYDYGFGGNRDM